MPAVLRAVRYMEDAITTAKDLAEQLRGQQHTGVVAKFEDTDGDTGSPRRVCVLVVDDQEMVREGLLNVLSKDVRLVVGDARDGVQALKAFELQQPDVVLMDVNMPQMNGVETAREIHRRWPQTAIIGLSVSEDDATAQAMIEAGASAFMPKSGSSAKLIKTIVDLAAGREKLN
jgi:DNA-binding NarL/FixJ family response regulator